MATFLKTLKENSVSGEIVKRKKEKPEKPEKPEKGLLFQFQEDHYLLPILTTRFTDATWLENREYAKRLNCHTIYCAPMPISPKIMSEANCAVLEMNNTTNKIIGIGLIQNISYREKFHIYEAGHYNRYSYVGKRRINREECTEEEETVMQLLDTLCFKGSGHLKRGQGLTIFPMNHIYQCFEEDNIDIVQIIRTMFNSRKTKKSKP